MENMINDASKMLQMHDIHKSFGDLKVLKGIDIEVNRGEVLAIIGPSGSGKSTLLRCINKLETIDSGSIAIKGDFLVQTNADGKAVYADNKKTREILASTGMVFQQFNLFANLTVTENITLAPVKLKLMDDKMAYKKGMELLENVGLKDKANVYPSSLSGNQKQRVSIVRTLMMNPDIILFDEPTSALDPEMVQEVLELIREVSKMGKTMIIVSHEMSFVRDISNRILFLDDGKIIFDGKNKDFFLSEYIRIKEFLDKIKK